MPWWVVKFLNGNEVEAVPTCWLKNQERGILLWPPYSHKHLIERAIKYEEMPCENWPEYEVKLLNHRPYDNFATANAKATKGCNTSDLESILPEKRISKKVVFESTSDEDDGDLNEVPRPYKSAPKKTEVKRKVYQKDFRCRASHNGTELESIDHISSDIDSSRSTTPQSSTAIDRNSNTKTNNANDTFQKYFIDLILKQKMHIKDLDTKVTELHNKIDTLTVLIHKVVDSNSGMASTQNENVKEIFFDLPVVDCEHFDRLEQNLMNHDVFNGMVDNLYRIGGQDFKDCVRRFLKKVLQDSVAAKYSLHGHKKKNVFKTTKVYMAITKAIQLCDKDVSLKNVELVIGQWLAKAPERLKRYESMTVPIQEENLV